MISIEENTQIHEDELRFVASRSGGPGGQNVNKVSTRVTLLFNIDESPSLTEGQKTRIRQRLSTRVSKGGVLRVVCQRRRSQSQNRKAAVERFTELVKEALSDSPSRMKTRVPMAVKKQRLKDKFHRSLIKRIRSKPVDLDE